MPIDERDRSIPGLPDDEALEVVIDDELSEGEVTENDDGSADVTLPTDPEKPEQKFYDNLAEVLPENELQTIATTLLDLIERDQQAREKRDKQYEEGIRRTGLGDDAPGGAEFSGASRVVHPILAEGCVDFAARAMKELFPSKGPVKTKLLSPVNEPKLKKAKQKRDYLNWKLQTKMEEYRPEQEQLLTQLPLGGSQYQKFYLEEGTTKTEFVPVDKIYLPFAASSFYTAPRVTHEQNLLEHIFEKRVKTKFYRNLELTAPASPHEESAAEAATDKVEGKNATGYNDDGERTVYEVTCWWEVNDPLLEEDDSAPYIIHIDKETTKVLAIYRNWKESDEKRVKRNWWVEYAFIPWRGAYAIGLPHLIGGLSGALTGALRAILDAAHIANAQTLLKLKSGRVSGQNTEIAITQVTEIEGPAGIDDVRKLAMPVPFPGPSPVLFQVMDWLTGQAKGVVATAEERIADAGANMPVGTALALIEQGSQVFSSIHARLHDSQRRALRIICELEAEYPDQEGLQKFGLTAQDFVDNDDIEPVSDPNIFSESQRYAQFQAVMQMSADPTVQYNKTELHRWGLELLRVDMADTLLPKPPQPVTADPVTENVAAMVGSQLKAMPQQDHLAHLQGHLNFILDPMVAANPTPAPQLAGILQHVQQHLIFHYQQTALAAAPMVAQQSQMSGEQLSPDAHAAKSAAMAAATNQETMQTLLPMLAQAQQVVAQKTPPPPVDPAIQKTFEASMAEIQRKGEYDKQMLGLKNQELGNSNALKQQGLMLQKMGDELSAQTELRKNEADNYQKQMTELRKNSEDNQTQYVIAMERLRQDMEATAQKREDTLRTAMMDQMKSEMPAAPEMPDMSPHIQKVEELMGRAQTDRTQEALTAALQGIHGMMQVLSAPKRIIEQNGKPVGIEPVL